MTKENKTVDYVTDWLVSLKHTVFTSTDIKAEDISIRTRLSKPTYEYKSRSAQVLLAEEMIKNKILQQPNKDAGLRLDYVMQTTEPRLTAVYVKDFDGTWDREYYWNVKIY